MAPRRHTEKLADSCAELMQLRLFVLDTTWKIDNSSTTEAYQEYIANRR